MANFHSLPPTDILVYSYIKSLILNQLFQSDGVSKINELAVLLQDHEISTLTLKNFLVSNAKVFTYLDGYWVPNTRISLKGLSAQRNVKAIIENINIPIPINVLAQEVSRISNLALETSTITVRRLALHDPEFFLTDDEKIGLGKWAFRAQNHSIDQALKANQVNEKHFNFYKEVLAHINWTDKDAFNQAASLLSEIDIKALGAIMWEQWNNSNDYHNKQFEWKSFYASLLSISDWIYCEGFLFPKSLTAEWNTKAPILAANLKSEIILESAQLDVKPIDIEKMVQKILSTSQTVTIRQLLEDFFEIFPNTINYNKDADTLIQHLIDQKQIQWLGGDRFQAIKEAPEHVRSIPELFNFEKSAFKNELDELIDFEISNEGLSSSLVSIMNHPLAIDVLDTEGYIPPTITSPTYRFILKAIHRELGTFPLCQFPAHWISSEPNLQELVFINPEGKKIYTWANIEVGLIFDFIDWWYEQPIESGAIFTLKKTIEPNVFQFQWEDTADPVVYISNQKMEILRSIDSTDKSTFELLCQLFQYWPKGVDFLTLLWEINIIRRSTRRLIASLINSYECFYQRSGSSVWFFEPKKVSLGINKGKKRFIIK